MATSTHPDYDLLKRYARHADLPEFDGLRLHLATCSECRAQVDAMSSLHQQYPWFENAACSEQQQQLIVDYTEQRLPAEQTAQVEQLLNENPAAMKAALHYASHYAAMRQAVTQQAPVQSTKAGGSLINKIRKRLVNPNPGNSNPENSNLGNSNPGNWLALRTPLWMTVPATAITVAVLAIVLQTTLPFGQDGIDIVSFQDNPVIQYRGKEQLPGIGFFNKADSAVASYGNVAVSMLNSNEITLEWPKVDGAILYKMRLQVFHQGDKLPLGEVSTDQNMAQYTINDSASNRRYEWILSGQTSDDKTFYASGGFVIRKN